MVFRIFLEKEGRNIFSFLEKEIFDKNIISDERKEKERRGDLARRSRPRSEEVAVSQVIIEEHRD